MRIISAHLSALGRASDLVEPDTSQGLEVPAELNPVISLRGPVDALASVTEIERQSFGNQDTIVQPASTAATARRLCTFSRGLWEITVGCEAVFNFSLLTGTNGDVRVELVTPNGSVFDMVSFLAFNGAPRQAYWLGVLLFAQDNWQAWHECIATGVGQQIRVVTHINANRLN